MKYVDWVESVLLATVDAFDAGDGFRTSIEAVAGKLVVDAQEAREPLNDAFRDLGRMGLVTGRADWDVRVEQEGRKARVAALSTAWPAIHDIWLEPRQEEFLTQLSAMSERPGERWAHLELVEGHALLGTLVEAPTKHESAQIIHALSELPIPLVDPARMTSGYMLIRPTYAGIVRVTEKVATESQSLVRGLLPDWETTNVDFKRELHLGTNDEKAEFVRDVLALANTQVTGSRYLVVGFDPKTHEFTTPADPAITQDRIEDILNHYARPPATIGYTRFPWTYGSGDVGVIEVKRDRSRVPYRVARGLAGARRTINENDVFVRHGSHVEVATAQEVADLEAEALRARTQPPSE